jgi:hypothetical protein
MTKSSTEVNLSPTSKPQFRSMTGYAMVRGAFEGWVIRVSVKPQVPGREAPNSRFSGTL